MRRFALLTGMLAAAGCFDGQLPTAASSSKSLRQVTTTRSLHTDLEHAVMIESPVLTEAVRGGTANFGLQVTDGFVLTGTAVQAVDSDSPIGTLPSTTSDGCTAFTNAGAIEGNIALISRGVCEFGVKALNAQNAGATAVIIYNNQPGLLDLGEGSVGSQVTIPVFSVTQDVGMALRFASPVSVTIRLVHLDIEAPTLTVPADIVVDATDANGAIVNFVATAADLIDEDVAAECSPVSGSVFAIGTTVVTCTATDHSGNSASASFHVTVLGAPEQIGDVQAQVTGFDLHEGTETSLLAKMSAATDALAAGDTAAACGSLGAAINQITAQIDKKITAAEAGVLIAEIQAIRSVIGCSA